MTYWAPRHSAFRFSATKYGTDKPEDYLTNGDDCTHNPMGCYVYDTDFLDNGYVTQAEWKRAVDIMSKESHMLIKSYYGRNIIEGIFSFFFC